jgi:hypothetical protein
MNMPSMNASKPHPAVVLIQAKIAEFHELEADFKNDLTLKLATEALDSAKAAAVAAEAEDETVDPEELVDRRIEARRSVEVAEIRLTRAQKTLESRGHVVRTPLIQAGDIAVEALRAAAEPFGERLEAELRKLIGDEFYLASASFYQNLIFGKQDRLYGHARQLESAVSIPGLNQAIAHLEEVARLG